MHLCASLCVSVCVVLSKYACKRVYLNSVIPDIHIDFFFLLPKKKIPSNQIFFSFLTRKPTKTNEAKCSYLRHYFISKPFFFSFFCFCFLASFPAITCSPPQVADDNFKAVINHNARNDRWSRDRKNPRCRFCEKWFWDS